MRNLILAATALVAFTSFAEARDRYQHRHYHQPQYHRHYHQPPVHRNHNRYIYGGIGLGLLGAGAYYYSRPTRCWFELVEVDYSGNPVYIRQCE